MCHYLIRVPDCFDVKKQVYIDFLLEVAIWTELYTKLVGIIKPVQKHLTSKPLQLICIKKKRKKKKDGLKAC